VRTVGLLALCLVLAPNVATFAADDKSEIEGGASDYDSCLKQPGRSFQLRKIDSFCACQTGAIKATRHYILQTRIKLTPQDVKAIPAIIMPDCVAAFSMPDDGNEVVEKLRKSDLEAYEKVKGQIHGLEDGETLDLIAACNYGAATGAFTFMDVHKRRRDSDFMMQQWNYCASVFKKVTNFPSPAQ
jgi:hypothetical protein